MEKERFFEAVLQLQEDKPLSNISVRNIAQKLNISTGLLYYHFKNKDDLLNQMFRQFKANIYNSIKDIDDSTYNILYSYINYNRENIYQFQFTFSSELNSLLTQESLDYSYSIHLKILDKFGLSSKPIHISTIVFGSIRSLLTAPPYFKEPNIDEYIKALIEIID